MYREANMWGDLPKDAPIRVADIYDWFLKNATLLTGMDVELTDAENKLSPFYKPEIKQCYYNSMMAHPSLEYWEGWATSMIPLNHAWNVKDGKVVDTTWCLLDHQRGKAEHILYFGIYIPREFIVSQLRNDVGDLERQVAELEEQVDEQEEATRTLIRVESELTHLRDILDRIEDLVTQ